MNFGSDLHKQMLHRLIISFSALFELLHNRRTGGVLAKGWRLWRREGLNGVRRWLNSVTHYRRWVREFDTITSEDRRAIVDRIAQLEYAPVISVLMPTYNTQEVWLRRAIDSVREQLYPKWELCIADDASTQPHVRAVLEDYARMDDRIRLVFREGNGHISAASNSALELASGDFVALLDHDDELPSHALYMVAEALSGKPDLDLIYSDEDKIDQSGVRFDPYFKPDWNPDLLTAQNMVSHLGVYRTEIVRRIGGFRCGYEGSQDWDLALRVSDAIPASHIHHIPHVLYHWRAIEGSTAVSVTEKSYAVEAGMAAVREHLGRTGCKATVSLASERHMRVSYSLPDPLPLVSIIIPTRNGLKLLRRCIDSISNKTRYAAYEILIVDNQSNDPDVKVYLTALEDQGIARIFHYDNVFNYSAINNFAVQFAEGDLLCLMNNDVEAISDDWLDEMVSQAVRPGVGAVGAMLYYPNDTIQHAGVVVGLGGIAGHLYTGLRRGETGYIKRACLVQNLSAITAACLVVRKDVYQEVDGLDEENLPVAFNDVDFCLRLMERGYRNLWTPFAELYHHESATRGPEDTLGKQQRFQAEVAYMRLRWSHVLDNDPAYNPNLTLDHSWPKLAAVPRVRKPW